MEEEANPQFNHYGRIMHKMMKNIGYNLTRGEGLCFGKGRRTPLLHFLPKGKPNDYYHKSRRGLGYVSPSSAQSHKSWKGVEDDHSTDA